MLTQTMTRDGIDISPIVTADTIHGVALILGYSPEAAHHLCANPKVGTVIMVHLSNAPVAPHPKLVVIHDDPYKTQRRFVLTGPAMQGRRVMPDRVDYLFCDLSNDPWDLRRINLVRDRVKEFRPKRAGYRWQEIDISAHWIATGRNLDVIGAGAMLAYRIETGIAVEPVNKEYAAHCAEVTLRYAGKVK